MSSFFALTDYLKRRKLKLIFKVNIIGLMQERGARSLKIQAFKLTLKQD